MASNAAQAIELSDITAASNVGATLFNPNETESLPISTSFQTSIDFSCTSVRPVAAADIISYSSNPISRSTADTVRYYASRELLTSSKETFEGRCRSRTMDIASINEWGRLCSNEDGNA